MKSKDLAELLTRAAAALETPGGLSAQEKAELVVDLVTASAAARPGVSEQAPAAIQVSLDGGESYLPADSGVRVIYSDVMIPGEDGRGELHINLSEEGIISDLWTTRDAPLDHNIGTSALNLDDLVHGLVDDPVDADDAPGM